MHPIKRIARKEKSLTTDGEYKLIELELTKKEREIELFIRNNTSDENRVYITQKEIAVACKTSRTTVSIFYKKMQEGGYMRVIGHRCIILSPEYVRSSLGLEGHVAKAIDAWNEEPIEQTEANRLLRSARAKIRYNESELEDIETGNEPEISQAV